MILATLCYIKNNGKTLMMHRIKRREDNHAGKWNGLGGKIDPGETPEECVIREVKEESGLSIRNPRLKGFLTFPSFDGFDDWYVFVFTTHKFKGKLTASAEGELAWIADADLLDLPQWEGDRIFLPWLDKESLFSAKFVYHKGKLTDHAVVFYGG